MNSQSSTPKPLINVIKVVLCLGLITLVVVVTFFLFPANVHYRVTERYIFSGDDEDASVYLGIMLPRSGPYQQVENIQISWAGARQEETFGFLDTAKLSGMKRGAEDQVATIEYSVKLSQGFLSWSAPVKSFQRLPQAGIESDCKCMQEKAASITGKGKSGWNAYKVYAFTVDYLKYSKEDADCTSVSAVKALEIGSCACTGFSRLMTALCRAADIPSQMVLGLVYPDPMFRSHVASFPQNPYEAHAWVEYYTEGSWKMADPTWGAILPKLMQFNRSDARHLVYGELEQVLAVDAELETWAFGQAEFILGTDHCFRYIAVSDSKRVSFLPQVSIQRKWDGRWLNTLVVWAVATYLMCRFRDKIFS